VSTLLITSPEPGDGKTITTLNLGIAAGRDGQIIIAVDADLQHRDLSELCHINGRVGLTDMAHANRDLVSGQYTWLVDFPGIQVIPAGAHVRDTTSVVTSPTFGSVMASIRERGDLVLVDSPALSEGPEALEIAKYVDAAVLVVNPRTPLGVLRATRQRLHAAGIPLLGCVVNGEVFRGQLKRQTNGSFPAQENGRPPVRDVGVEWDSTK
jgi:Mrp family chromosome partitioning ATPase